MADVAPAGLSPAHPAVGPLGPLLERLHREDLLAVGADRAARAEELLQRLAAAGISLMTADAAADWLAPVLCRSEREQRALRERLRADAPARADAVESTSRPGPPPATGISATALVPDRPSRNRARFWRLLALAVVAAVVLAILSVAIMAPRSPVVPKAPLDAPGMFDPRLGLLLPWAAGIAVALLLGHRDFVRLRAGLPPAPRAPQPGGDVLPLLPEGRLRTAMRGLSRRIAPGGTLLDLPRTLAATVRNAGVPTLAYGGRPLLPRYVLLADMAGSADSQRLPAEALRRRMTEAGLEVSAFAFQRSPGALRPWGGARRGIRLARMASRQRGARLLVSSDAAGLRGNEAGLADFPERILLTPRPPSAWGVREAALIADGWQVVTMDGTGVARIAAWLSGPRDPAPLPPPRQAGSSTVDLPTVLERDPTLNDPFHAPPADVLARLLKRLRDDLGAAGYQLLATLAAGPDASAPMVEQIAAHLGAQGVTLPDAAKSALLLRVPWLRRGALPGWLRAALVESMLPEWHEPARVAWLLHQSGQSVALPASPARRLVLPERETARLARLVANSLGNDGDPLLLQMVRGGAMARAMPWALSWRTSLSYALVVGTLLAGVQQGVERYGGALWKELLYAVAQQIRSALLVGLQVAALALMAVCLRWPRCRRSRSACRTRPRSMTCC